MAAAMSAQALATLRRSILDEAAALVDEVAPESLRPIALTRLAPALHHGVAAVAIAARSTQAAVLQQYRTALPEPLVRCAVTGLMPGPSGGESHVWLIPRAGRLDWQISIRGWLHLVEEAGHRLDAVPVYSGDRYHEVRRLGGESLLEHESRYVDETGKRLRRGAAELVCVYVAAYRVSDDALVGWRTCSRDQLDALQASARDGSVWTRWYESRALSSALGWAIRRRIVPVPDVGGALSHAIAWDAESAQPEEREPATTPPETPETPPETPPDTTERDDLLAQIRALGERLSPAVKADAQAVAGVERLRQSTPIEDLRRLRDELQARIPVDPPTPEPGPASGDIEALELDVGIDLARHCAERAGVPWGADDTGADLSSADAATVRHYLDELRLVAGSPL